MLVIDEFAKEAVGKAIGVALDNGTFPALMERLHFLHTYASGDHQTDPSAFSRCHLYHSREPGLDFMVERPKRERMDEHGRQPAILDSNGQVKWEPWFYVGLVYLDYNGEWGVHT